ncbi:hypothetical protein PALB_590 [Pseudoalteromonas luteoviolacea B = ATCC 29581]|nr:hypothetical protein PALB_590 [Pseudoalteromonas luteoviolacea B = ATCC 29581]
MQPELMFTDEEHETFTVSDEETTQALLLFGLENNQEEVNKDIQHMLWLLKKVCGIEVEELAEGVVNLKFPAQFRLPH